MSESDGYLRTRTGAGAGIVGRCGRFAVVYSIVPVPGSPASRQCEGRCHMSFMDTLKGKLGMSKDKAGDYAREHPDKVDSGIEKGGQTADSRTGGKHSDQIDTGVDKAKGAVDDYGNQGGGQGSA